MGDALFRQEFHYLSREFSDHFDRVHSGSAPACIGCGNHHFTTRGGHRTGLVRGRRVQQRGTAVRSFVARSNRSFKRSVCCNHPKVPRTAWITAVLLYGTPVCCRYRTVRLPETGTCNTRVLLVFHHRIVRALTDTLPFPHPAALRIHHRDQPAKSAASTAAQICYETAHCTVSQYFVLNLSG